MSFLPQPTGHACDRVSGMPFPSMPPLIDALAAAALVRSSSPQDPGLVFLDATLPPVGVPQAPDVHARYIERHLPGAVFFDIEELSEHNTPLPHMLPRPEAFAREMARLGIGSNMTLIVYEQAGVFSAPRAWWMLRSFGVREVYVLDGGLRAWTDAGLPTESGDVQRPPAYFQAQLEPEAVVSLAQLKELLAAGGQVLDARPGGRFQGTAPEPRPGLRSGHMPGATSVPLGELLEDGRLRSPEALRAIFAARGVDLEQPITTTCGSGVTAAGVALALKLSGAKNVNVYDGSWAEYASQPEAVIVSGK